MIPRGQILFDLFRQMNILPSADKGEGQWAIKFKTLCTLHILLHSVSPLNLTSASKFQRNGCLEFWSTQWAHLTAWLLDVEMGVVWSVASLSIISFIFASIW